MDHHCNALVLSEVVERLLNGSHSAIMYIDLFINSNCQNILTSISSFEFLGKCAQEILEFKTRCAC